MLTSRLNGKIIRALSDIVGKSVEVRFKLFDSENGAPLLALIAEDKDLVTYRPRLNKITGSVNGTILLQQVIYWWYKSKRRPFYKFFAPCNHPAYREGDSWQEELGFSRWEMEGALKKIAANIKKGESKDKALQTAFVLFWTDGQRKTWFELNEDLVRRKIMELYS